MGETERWAIELCAERGETERWAMECCVLTEGRKCAVGDTVLCAERGETERWAMECFVLIGEKLSVV